MATGIIVGPSDLNMFYGGAVEQCTGTFIEVEDFAKDNIFDGFYMEAGSGFAGHAFKSVDTNFCLRNVLHNSLIGANLDETMLDLYNTNAFLNKDKRWFGETTQKAYSSRVTTPAGTRDANDRFAITASGELIWNDGVDATPPDGPRFRGNPDPEELDLEYSPGEFPTTYSNKIPFERKDTIVTTDATPTIINSRTFPSSTTHATTIGVYICTAVATKDDGTVFGAWQIGCQAQRIGDAAVTKHAFTTALNYKYESSLTAGTPLYFDAGDDSLAIYAVGNAATTLTWVSWLQRWEYSVPV